MKLRLFVLLLLVAVMPLGASEEVAPLEIGQPAPAFELPGVDGKTYSLNDFADAKILAVIFSCNHCPTAQAYEERIKQLVTEYEPKDVAFVAVSPNDEQAVRLDELGYTDLNDGFEDMKIRAKVHNFNFPYLYAGDKPEISKAYGPAATPHVFIFDAERKLRYRGRIDNNERLAKVETHDTRDALDALLAGKEVEVTTTKTFGCSIKWPDKRDSVKESFEKWAKEEVTVKPINVEEVKTLMNNDSDKLRLINVWATFCGPCVQEFPDLVEINRMYRHREFEMITISADAMEDKDKVLEFLKKNEASMTNYQFSGDDTYDLIEAIDPKWEGQIPYTLLIKPGGEVIYRHPEAIDPLEVKRKIVDVIGRVYK